MSIKYKRVKQKDGTYRHEIVRDKARKIEAKAKEEAAAANNAGKTKEKPKKAKGKGDAGAKK